VKSLTQEASIGISRASVVRRTTSGCRNACGSSTRASGPTRSSSSSSAGRELYVGVLGNQRLEVFPIWELRWDKMPRDGRLIMTDRAKWNTNYQKSTA